MGGGWLTFRDLSLIGAGQYKALQYSIPDLFKDGLIEEIQTARKSGKIYKVYKINSLGLSLLQAAENHVQEEYSKAMSRIEAFKTRWNIENRDR
jgi:DNA-binding PadR family transcriptional regulator